MSRPKPITAKKAKRLRRESEQTAKDRKESKLWLIAAILIMVGGLIGYFLLMRHFGHHHHKKTPDVDSQAR